MADISSYFDRTGTLKRPDALQFLREFGAVLTDRTPPPTGDLPDGAGQVVLVLPAFLTGDGVTRTLRRFLQARGFRAYGWEFGVNVGPTGAALRHVRRRAELVADLNGGPIALVGVSLGGLLARGLAHEAPGLLRHVATLASPFRLPTASPLEPLVRLCRPFFDANINPAAQAAPLPVPSTAFYTRDDGIVAWESCVSEGDPNCLNIEVSGPHMTICRNPTVLTRLVERIAPHD